MQICLIGRAAREQTVLLWVPTRRLWGPTELPCGVSDTHDPGFYQTWTLDNQPRGFNLEQKSLVNSKAMPNDFHIWSKT